MVRVCLQCDKPIYHKNKQGKYKCYSCNQWLVPEQTTIRPNKPGYITRKPKGHTKTKDLITRNELVMAIDNMKMTPLLYRNQCLLSMLYVSAARIEEIVGLIDQKSRKRLTPAIKRKQIDFRYLNGKEFMILQNVPVLKRRSNLEIVRDIPICVDNETVFVDHIKRYALMFDMDEEIFDITYQRAWQIMQLCMPGKYNHYLRHLRLTHLTREHGLSGMDLTELTGWSSEAMANRYVHLRWQDIAKKMM